MPETYPPDSSGGDANDREPKPAEKLSDEDWFKLSAVGELEAHGHDAAAPDTVVEPFPLVGGYEILDLLGKGESGPVYKARQIKSGQVVALKLVLAPPGSTAQDAARTRGRAEAAASVRHAGAVQTFEVGSRTGLVYLATEFMAGGNLSAHTCGRPQPPEYAAALIEMLAGAVHAFHALGLPHLGISPARVLLDQDGRAKLTGFGRSHRSSGAAGYRAPEQVDGAGVGPAADIYALGAILYELLTGRPPFLGISSRQTLEHVVKHKPVAPRLLQPDLPRDIETICLTCLQKHPARRYASAQQLADDLRRFCDGRPILARPVGWRARLGRWLHRRGH